MAAKIVNASREDVNSSLGLYLQYDKPHELRLLQKEAYKFLSVVKRQGGDLVQSKQLKNGFLVINGVRIAPEYLVPGPARWDFLVDAILQKIRSWKNKTPPSPEYGVLTDAFGYAYTAGKGVFDLDDIPEDGDEPMSMYPR
jgi:hypothetical protein